MFVFEVAPSSPSPTDTQWDLSLATLFASTDSSVVDFRTLESAQSHLVNSGQTFAF